jgi:hypothetical protein
MWLWAVAGHAVRSAVSAPSEVAASQLPVTLRLAPSSKLAWVERSRKKGRCHEYVEMLGARNRRHQPVTRLSTFAPRIASLAQLSTFQTWSSPPHTGRS